MTLVLGGKKKGEQEEKKATHSMLKEKHNQKPTNVKLGVLIEIIIGMRQRLFIALLLYKHLFALEAWGWNVNKFDLSLWN